MDCFIYVKYLKHVLDMKVMIMAYNHIKVKIIHESQDFLLIFQNEPTCIKSEEKVKIFLKINEINIINDIFS